jgi:uncharacterized protein
LAARGSNLVLVASTKTALEGLAERLRREHGVRVEVIAADLSDIQSPEFIMDEVARLGIAIDLLLNNPAAGYSGSFFGWPIHKEFTPSW